MPTRIVRPRPVWSEGVTSNRRFPHERRLIKQEVVILLESGARFNRGEFALRLGQNTAGLGRLAISVPKRILKRATDRNYIKRVIREEFRQHEVRARPVDVLITLRSHTSAGLVESGGPGENQRRRRDMLRDLLTEVSRRFGVPA